MNDLIILGSHGPISLGWAGFGSLKGVSLWRSTTQPVLRTSAGLATRPGKSGFIPSRLLLRNPLLKPSSRGEEWRTERTSVFRARGGRKIGGMKTGWTRTTC